MGLRWLFPIAVLLAAVSGQAVAADTFTVAMVQELLADASHAHFGATADTTFAFAGRPIPITVSIDRIVNITVRPRITGSPFRQISIGVTTTGTGVVPNALTVITAEDQVQGYTLVTTADGAISEVVAGGPVTVPPATQRARTHDGQPPSLAAATGSPPGSGDGSDLVDGSPPAPAGSPIAGAGIVFAPGTSPASQSVSPH